MAGKPEKYLKAHSVIIVELDGPNNRRKPGKPHLHITSTSLQPEKFFENLVDRYSNLTLPGKPMRLRLDLVGNYKSSRSKDAIKRRMEETTLRLSRLGHAINGDDSVWSIYVLNVNPDLPTPLLDRGKRNHVVYVGQTSKDIKVRELEHRGESFGKSGKYLGAPSTKGRNPRLNLELTPIKKFYNEPDAKKFESIFAHYLKRKGYRVLGDGLTDQKNEL